MMEGKIKALKNVDISFETIKQETIQNLEIAWAEKQMTTKRKSPYLRAVRRVSYTLCVCMAATFLALALHNGSFDWMIGGPGIDPAGSDSGGVIDSETEDLPPAHEIDPGKSEYFAITHYDKYLAFATFIKADVILNSDLLNDKDHKAFFDYIDKTGNDWFNIHMGTRGGIDTIRICDLKGPEYDSFEFISNLDYSYADILSDFEKLSGVEISVDKLTESSGVHMSENGIALMFKYIDGKYIPYYEAVLNDKAYVVDREVLEGTNVELPVSEDLPSYSFSGFHTTGRMNEEIVKFFDKFFAFGTVPFWNNERFYFLSAEDFEHMMDNREHGNNNDYYLGVKDGKDVVVVAYPDGRIAFIFESNLNYRYADVIAEFEKQSGVTLTDDFLNTSVYNSTLLLETGGILMNLRYQTEYEDMHSYRDGSYPYFRAMINGKIYVVNPEELTTS